MSLPNSNNGKGSPLSQECDIDERDSCSCYNIHIQVAESKSEIDLRIESDVPHKQSPHRTLENAAVGSKSAKHVDPHKVTIFTHDKSMDNVHIEYKNPKNSVAEGMKENSQTYSKEKGKPHQEDIVGKSYHCGTDDRRREENRYRQESQDITQNDHKRPPLRTRTLLYTKREVKNPREAVARLEARQGLFSRSIQQYVIRAVDLCTTPFMRSAELREERSKSKINPEVNPNKSHHKSEARTTSSIEDNKTNNLSQESDGKKYKGQFRDKRFRMHIDDLDYKKVDNGSEFIRKNNEIQKNNSGTESRPAELELEIENANKSNEQAEAIISQFNSSQGKNLSEIISNTKTPELHNIPKGKFREKIDTSQNVNRVEDINESFKDYSEKLDKVQDSNRQIFHNQNVCTKCEKSISFHDTNVIGDEKSPVKRKKRRLEDSPSQPKENLKLQENRNKIFTKSKVNVKSQRKYARRKTRSNISKLRHLTSDSSETDKDHTASFVQDRSLSASKKCKHRWMSPKNQPISPHEKTEESYLNYTKTRESKDQLNKDAFDAPVNNETSNSKSSIPNKQENQKNSEITEIFYKNCHSSPCRHHPEKQDKFPVQQHREGTKTNRALLTTSAKPKKKTGDISQKRKKSNEQFVVYWFNERNSQQEKSQVVEEGGETEKSSSEKDDDNGLTQDVFHNQNNQNHHVEQKQNTQISKPKDLGIYEDNKTTKYHKESRVQKVKYDTKDPDVAKENTEDTHNKDDLRKPSININKHESNETITESLQQKSFDKWQENACEDKKGSPRHSDNFISYKELAANRRRKKRYSKYKKRLSSQGSCRDMLYSVERGRTPPRSRKKRCSQEPRRESEHRNVMLSPYRENNAQPGTSRAIPEKTREDSISRRERSKSKSKEEKKNQSLTKPVIGSVGQYIKLEVPENMLLTGPAIADEMRPAMSSEWQFTKPEISDNGQFTRLEMPNKRQLTRPEISDNRQLTKAEVLDNRQLTRPEMLDNRQLTRPEMLDNRQLTRPEMLDNRHLTRPEMLDNRQLTRPEMLDNRQLTRPEMLDNRQLTESEITDNKQLTSTEIPDNRHFTEPEMTDEMHFSRPEIIVDKQLTRPEIADSRQFTGPETPDHRQLPRSGVVDERHNTRPELQEVRHLTKSKIPDKRRFKKVSEKPDKRWLIRTGTANEKQFTKPETTNEKQFTRPETANEKQFTKPEIADENQLLRTEKANNGHLTKFETVDDECHTRSEISGSKKTEKKGLTTEKSLRQDVSFKTKQHKKHYITKSKQSRKSSISGSIKLSEKKYKEKETKQVKSAQTKILVSVKTNNKNIVTANKQPEQHCVSANTSEDKTQTSDASNTTKGETKEEIQEVKEPLNHKSRTKMRKKDQISNNKHRPLRGIDETNLKSNTPSHLKESESKPEKNNQDQNQMPRFPDNIQKTKWEQKPVAYTVTATKRIELSAQGRDKMTRTKNMTSDKCANSEENSKMCKKTTDSDKSQRSATVEIKEKDILPFQTPLCKRKSTSTPPKRTEKTETVKPLSSPSDKGKKPPEMEKKDDKDVSKGNIKQKDEEVQKSGRRENTSHRAPWRSPGYQPRTSQSYPRRRKDRADMSGERKTGTVISEANYLPRVDESLVEESLQFLRDSFEGRNKILDKESTTVEETATTPAISPKIHSKQAQKSTQLTKNLSKRLCSNSSNETKRTARQHKTCEKEEQIIQNEKEIRKLNSTSESVQTRTQSRQRKCDIQRSDINTSRNKSASPKRSPLLAKRKFVRNEMGSRQMTPNRERKKTDLNAGKSPERTKTIEKETLAELNDIPSKMLIITLQDTEGEKPSVQTDLSHETNRSNDLRGEIIFGLKECKDGSSQEIGNCTSNSKCGTEMMDNSQETIRESTENTSQGAPFFFDRRNLSEEIVEGIHKDNKRLISERTFIKCSSDNKKMWNGRYEYLNNDNTDSSFGRQPPDNNAPDNKSSRVQRSARKSNEEEKKMCSTDDTEIQSYNTVHRKPDLSRSSNKRLPNKKQSRSRKHEEIHGSHTSNVVERQISKSDHKTLPIVASANKWVSDKQPSQSRPKYLHKTFAVNETDRTLEDSQSHSLDTIQSSINCVSNKRELQNRRSEDTNKNIVEIQLSNGDKDYLSSPLNITNWLQNKQSSFCRTPVNKSYTITNVGRQPPNHDEEKHTNELQSSRKRSPSKKPSDPEKNNVKENHFRKSRYQELLDEIQEEMNQLDILGISHINSIKGRRQVKSIIIPLKQAGDSNNFSSIELPEKRSIILPITDGSMNYLLSGHKLHHPANNPQPQIQVHYVTVAKRRNSSSDTSSSLSSLSEHNFRYRSVSRERKSPYRCREHDSNMHTSEGSLSNEEECSGRAHTTRYRRKTPEKVKKHRHGSKKTHKSNKETESQDRAVSRNRSVRIAYEPPSNSEKCPSSSTRSAAVTCPYPDEPEEEVIRSCFPIQSRHRPKRKAMYDPLAQPNSRRIPRRRSRRSSSTYDDTYSAHKHSSHTTVCSKKSTSSRKSRSRKHHKRHRHRRQLCDDDDDDSDGGDETECDEGNDKSKSSDSDVPPRRSHHAEYSKCPYRPPSVTLNYCELTYSSDSTQTSHRSPSTDPFKFNREPENSRSLGMNIKPSPIHEYGRATVPTRRADQKSRKAIKASNSQETATSAVASDVAAYGTSSDDYERVRKLKNTKKGGNVYNHYNVQTNVVPSFTSSLYDTLLFNSKYSECKEIFRHPKFLSSSSGKLNEHLSAEELGSFSFKRQDETTNQAKRLQMKLKNCLNKNYSEFECPKISQDENKFCKSFSEFSENRRKSMSLRYTKEALESFNRALKALPTTTKSTEYDRKDSGVQDNKAIELQVMKNRHQNLTELSSSPQIPLQEGMQYRRNKNNNPKQRFTGKEQKGKNSNLIKSTSKLTVNLFPLNAPKSTIVYMAGNVRNEKSSNQNKNVDKTGRCKCSKCQRVQMTSQVTDSSPKETGEIVVSMNRRTPKEVEPPVSVLYARGKTNNMTSKLPEHTEVHFEEEAHFEEGSDHSQGGNEKESQAKDHCQLKSQKTSIVEIFRNTTCQTPSPNSLTTENVHNVDIRCACREKPRQDKDYKFHGYEKADSSKMMKNMEIKTKISSSDSNASIISLSSKMSFTLSCNLPTCSGHCQIPEDTLISPPKPHSYISDEKLLAIKYEPKEEDEVAYGQVKELSDVLEKDDGKEKCEISLCEERACREAMEMKTEKEKQDERKLKEYKNQSHHSEDVSKAHTPEEDIKAVLQDASISPTHSYHSEDVLIEHASKEYIKAISKEASTPPRHSYHSEDVSVEHIPKEHVKAISKEASISPEHSYHSEDVLLEHTPEEHIIPKEASTSSTHSYYLDDVSVKHTPEEHIKTISKEASTSPRHSYQSEDVSIEHAPKEHIKTISKEVSTSPEHSYHSEDVLIEHTPEEHIKTISKEASTSPRHSYQSEDVSIEYTPKEHIKTISKEVSTSPEHSYHSEVVSVQHSPKEHSKAISKEGSTLPRHFYDSEDVLIEHTPKEHIKAISKEGSALSTHSHRSEDVLKEHAPEEHIKAISKETIISPRHSYHSEVVSIEHTPKEHIKAISKEVFTSPTHHSKAVLKEHTPEEDTKVISKEGSTSPRHYHSEDLLIEPTSEEYIKAISKKVFTSPTHHSKDVLKEHTPEEDTKAISKEGSTPPRHYHSKDFLIEPTSEECIKAISKKVFTSPAHHSEDILREHTPEEDITAISKDPSSPPIYYNPSDDNFQYISKEFQDFVKRDFGSLTNYIDSEDNFEQLNFNENARNDSKKTFSIYTVEDVAPPIQKALLARREIILESYLLAIQLAHIQVVILPSQEVYYERSPRLSVEEGGENSLMIDAKPSQGKCDCIWCVRSGGECSSQTCMFSNLALPAVPQDTTISLLSIVTSPVESILAIQSPQNTKSLLLQKMYNSLVSVKPSNSEDETAPLLEPEESTQNTYRFKDSNRSNKSDVGTKGIPEPRASLNKHQAPFNSSEGERLTGTQQLHERQATYETPPAENSPSSLAFRAKSKSPMNIEDTIPTVPQKGQPTSEETGDNVFDIKSQGIHPLPTTHSSTPSSHSKSSRSSGYLPFRIKKKSQTSIEDTNLPDNSVPQKGQYTSEVTGDNVFRISSKEKQSLPTNKISIASSNNKFSKTSVFHPFRTKKKSQTSIEDSDLADNSVSQKEQSTENEIRNIASNTTNQETNQLPTKHSSTTSSNNKSSKTSGCLPCRTKKKSQTSIEHNELPHNSVPQKGPSTTEIDPLPNSQSFTPSSYNKTAKSSGCFPCKTKRKSQVNIKDTDLPDDSTSQSSAQDVKDNSTLETPQLPSDSDSSNRNKLNRSGSCTIISSPQGELFLHFCPKHSEETIQLTPDTSDTQMDNKTLKRGVFEVVSLEEEKPFVSEMPNNSKEKTQPLEQQNKQHNISENKCQTGNRDQWHFCPLYPESYSAISSEEILITTAEEVPKSWSEVSKISTNLEDERGIMEDIGSSSVQVYHIIPDQIKNIFQLRDKQLHQHTDFSDSNDELISSCDLDKSISKSVQTVDRITKGSDSVYSVVPDISKVQYSSDNEGKNEEEKTDILHLSQERKPLKERSSNLKHLASVNSDHSPEIVLNTVPIKNDPSLRVSQKRNSSEVKRNNSIQTPTNSNLKSEIQPHFDHRDTDSSNKLKDGDHVKSSAEEEIQSLSNFLEELEVWQSQVNSEISLYFKLLNKDPPATSTEQPACSSATAERVKKANIKKNGSSIIEASGQQSLTDNGQSMTRNEGFSNLLPFSRLDKSINCITNPQNNSIPKITTASQQFQELSSLEGFSNFSSLSRPGETTDCITTTQINSLPELITTSKEFQKPLSFVGYEECDGIQQERDQNTKEEAGCSAYYSNSIPLVYSFNQDYVIVDGFETATSPGRVNVSPQTEDIIHAHERVIQPINPRNRQTTTQLVLVNNTFSAKENMKIVGKSSRKVSFNKTDKTENDLEMYYYCNNGSDPNNQYECSFENRENEYSQNFPELDDVRIFPSSETVELIDVALGSTVDNITKVEVHSKTQKKESLLPEGKSLDLLVTIDGSSNPETQLLHQNIFKYDSSITSTSTVEVLGTLSKPEISSSSVNDLQFATTETEKDYPLTSPTKNEKGTTREKFIKEMEDTSSKIDDTSNRIMKNYENFCFELDPITQEKGTNEKFRNETKNMNESGSSVYTMRKNKQWCSHGSDEELLTLSINTSQEVTFSIDVIESDLSVPDSEKDNLPIYFKVLDQKSGESIEQPDILNDFEQTTDFSKSNNKEDTDYIQIHENMYYTIPKAFNTEISAGNSKTISINNHSISNTYSGQDVTLLQSNSEDFLEDKTHESTRRQIQAAVPQANMKKSLERKKFGLDKDLLLEAADHLLPQTERKQVKNSHPVLKSQNVKKKVHIQDSSTDIPKRKKEDVVLSVKNLDHSKHTLVPVAKKSSSSNKSRRNVDSERGRDDLNTPKEAKLKKKVFFGLLGGWSQHHKIDKSSGSRHDVPPRLLNAKSRDSTNFGSARVTKNCEDSKKDHRAEASTSAQQASRMFWPSCVKKIVQQAPRKAKNQGSREDSR